MHCDPAGKILLSIFGIGLFGFLSLAGFLMVKRRKGLKIRGYMSFLAFLSFPVGSVLVWIIGTSSAASDPNTSAAQLYTCMMTGEFVYVIIAANLCSKS